MYARRHSSSSEATCSAESVELVTEALFAFLLPESEGVAHGFERQHECDLESANGVSDIAPIETFDQVDRLGSLRLVELSPLHGLTSDEPRRSRSPR